MTRKHESSPRREEGERIAKVMARAGLCSRRDAEAWIAAGRVAVNGGTIRSPAVNVSARDRVTVDGKPLPQRERTRLFRYYKPVGLVSTNADPQGRPTLFDALPAGLPRLVSVGRLDIGTEGLLLLTNDGGLARVLELPKTQWVRRYRVRAHGSVTQADLDTLADGITIDGVHYGPIIATLEREQGSNLWLSFEITEGKNREVRNVLGHLGLQVNRLIRVAFGPFALDEMAEGAIEEVETKTLRAMLGAEIIAAAGCDFSRPALTHQREARPHQREARREPHRPAHAAESFRKEPRGNRKRHAGRDDRPDKPMGRPRRGHAWREDDAPLKRTYRGSRRDDLKMCDADHTERRAGLVTDRKGRRVLAERFGAGQSTKDARDAESVPPRKATRAPRRPARDRSGGPRSSRPKPPERKR
jgi:23S rRNA pseudouridine2605 synthase